MENHSQNKTPLPSSQSRGWKFPFQLTKDEMLVVDDLNGEGNNIVNEGEQGSYDVSISTGGRVILSISDRDLSGVDDIEEYDELIEYCARQLLSFIGRKFEIEKRVNEF